MSHVAALKGGQYNVQVLKNMCQRQGWTLKEKNTYKWYGRHVGDYPLPDGFTVKDLGKCDVAIQIPGIQYEIGCVNKNDELVFLYDFWDKNLKNAVGGEKAESLKMHYEFESKLFTVNEAGYEVLEQGFNKQTQSYYLRAKKPQMALASSSF